MPPQPCLPPHWRQERHEPLLGEVVEGRHGVDVHVAPPVPAVHLGDEDPVRGVLLGVEPHTMRRSALSPVILPYPLRPLLQINREMLKFIESRILPSATPTRAATLAPA